MSGLRDRDVTRRPRSGVFDGLLLGAALLAIAGCAAEQQPGSGVVEVAVLASNDVHGQLLPDGERGGITVFSGYVDALRRSGTASAVLVVDAGDMWQGTLESNLDEGASVVAAYNAIGYAAAAVGNHEFDFGPAGDSVIRQMPSDDPRGALRARAGEADFPLLVANLVVAGTARPPEWQNVVPAVLVDVAGLKAGIVGLITNEALSATIAANVADLEVTPLAQAAMREIRSLRRQGADLVIIAAHAGSRCDDFADPADLSSCDPEGELFQLARALPPGSVDLILGGHKHHGIAHVVNGIPVVSAYSRGRAFSRVDLTFDRARGQVTDRRIHAPRALCPYQYESSGECAWQPGTGVVPARYAGKAVVPDPQVVRIAETAGARAQARRDAPIGVDLAGPFTLEGNPGSQLARLFTRAMLEAVGGDVAIHNVTGGLRADLPAGPLTYGMVYEVFPFDNRVSILRLSGREFRRVIAAQATKASGRAAIAGLDVAAVCRDGTVEVSMRYPDGRPVRDTDRLEIVANDFLALGGDGIFDPILPPGGFRLEDNAPLVREVFIDWLGQHRELDPREFSADENPDWRIGPGVQDGCMPGR